ADMLRVRCALHRSHQNDIEMVHLVRGKTMDDVLSPEERELVAIAFGIGREKAGYTKKELTTVVDHCRHADIAISILGLLLVGTVTPTRLVNGQVVFGLATKEEVAVFNESVAKYVPSTHEAMD